MGLPPPVIGPGQVGVVTSFAQSAGFGPRFWDGLFEALSGIGRSESQIATDLEVLLPLLKQKVKEPEFDALAYLGFHRGYGYGVQAAFEGWLGDWKDLWEGVKKVAQLHQELQALTLMLILSDDPRKLVEELLESDRARKLIALVQILRAVPNERWKEIANLAPFFIFELVVQQGAGWLHRWIGYVEVPAVFGEMLGELVGRVYAEILLFVLEELTEDLLLGGL